MIVDNIRLSADGIVNCRSKFYTALCDFPTGDEYIFSRGLNWLHGEIDSGGWSVSYYLSMFGARPKDFVMYDAGSISVNGINMPISELLQYSCYMDDTVYPLFSGKQSVKKLVTKGIKENKLSCSTEDIKEMFCLDSQRFERPVSCVGNERFRAMAAIAYCNNKQVYCFPWFSRKKFDGYHDNIKKLLEWLEDLNKIVIIPVGEG